MELAGEMLLGYQAVRGTQGSQRAFNPVTNSIIDAPVFGMGGDADVERAAALAAAAFDPYRQLPLAQRAAFLDSIADEILALGDALLHRAHLETGLPLPRLQGERLRTVNQLRLFAQVVREGHFLSAILDSALPGRTPLPRSDLRLAKLPLGPVAVFGASNFPLAFSVAGGDTASALAAGAPVVVKAHGAHLGTSELVGCAIVRAAQRHQLPEGVFSLLMGAGNALGEALVAHPAIKAVGFTGSRAGGLALQRIAQARPEPIPVYAEMSSLNPVFLLPGALAQRAAGLAVAYVDSLTQGVGQFCTNPGLLLAIESAELDGFRAAVAAALATRPAASMLTPQIHAAYEHGVAQWHRSGHASPLASGRAAEGQQNVPTAAVYAACARDLLEDPALRHEVFGPAGLIVAASNEDELVRVAEALEGQLTATLLLESADLPLARRLLPILERRAGRILANGFPTGVEVAHAMVHGGPYPATSNAAFTSVGALAIERFLRPVCYQDLPAELLPAALQDSNPLRLVRRVDGKFLLP